MTGFDPVGRSGALNHGGEKEPGYCADRSSGGAFMDCALMEDGDRSNNIGGPNSLTMGPGSFSKHMLDSTGPWVLSEQRLPGQGAAHDGAAVIQPGEVHNARVSLSNNGVAFNEVGMCDVFDNTTVKLAPLKDRTGYSQAQAAQFDDDLYAYVYSTKYTAGKATQEAHQNQYMFEFASFDFAGDTANNGVFDVSTNRYGGNWDKQSEVRCTDDAADWKSSPDLVSGGIDAVNAVRVTSIDGLFKSDPGTAHYLFIALEQRDNFYGGPNNGKSIPAGTVVANFGNVTTNNLHNGWTNPRSYKPQPESASTDGDRWTVARALANLQKRTIAVDGVGSGGVADFGNTGKALAGDPVIWEIVATLAAHSHTPADVQNVVITDTLPKHVAYNDELTADLKNGTPADTYVVNADGTTTLEWNLGTVNPKDGIPSRIIYTETDGLAPSKTELVNKAEITADGIIPVSAHKDDHTVVLEQSGKLQLRKDVDQTLDLQDDQQHYVLTVKNFSENLQIDPITIIDVFSYNEDGTNSAEVNRTPASAFSGNNQLSGAPIAYDFGGTTEVGGTFYYTAADPATVSQHLDDDKDPSMWFTEGQFGGTGAPGSFADVTAIKFVAENTLTTESNFDGSGIRIKYSTVQTDNAAGDLYANRFTAFSDTFKSGESYQLLTSNQTTVRVVGFSLGDLVWLDQDADGKFTEGTDQVAPEGADVQVFKQDGESAVLVGQTTTNEDGRWILNDLATGNYYAQIPADQFGVEGKLYGYAPQPIGVEAEPNTDESESSDHHAVLSQGAVRSAGWLTLDATVEGSTIMGNEPLRDNVKSLRVSPLTTDDFTNFTLDLALKPLPGFTLDKVADPASGSTVLPGDSITYTVTGTNFGKTALDPVVVTDDLSQVLNNATLDGDITAVVVAADGVPGTPESLTAVADVVTWEGKLAVGEQVVISYSVTVNDDANGVILKNVANSSATPPGEDPIEPPTVETEHFTPGYEFSKTSDPVTGATVVPGETITYTLTGVNTGQTVLDPVVITDDLSKVLNNAELTGAPVVTVTNAAGEPVAGQPAAVVNATTLTWTGKLAVGEQVAVTYSVTVNEGAEGEILTNRASSQATPPNLPPLTPEEVITEHPVPGYELAKTSDPESGSKVERGEEITYTVTGTNTGATVLDPVVITDDLSKVLNNAELMGAPVVTVTDAKGELVESPVAVLDGTELTWEGTLQVGESVALTYTVKVHADAPATTLTNVAMSTATPPGGTEITPPPVETEHIIPPAKDPVVPVEPVDPPAPTDPEDPADTDGQVEENDPVDQDETEMPKTGANGVFAMGVGAIALLTLGLLLARRFRSTMTN